MENQENKVEVSVPIMNTGDQPDKNGRVWPTEVVREAVEAKVSGMEEAHEKAQEELTDRRERAEEKRIQETVFNKELAKEQYEQVKNGEIPAETEISKEKDPNKLFDENDENEVITEDQIKQMDQLIKTASEMVKFMDEQWDSTKKEYRVTEVQMKEVVVYNSNHARKMPEYPSSKEEKELVEQINASRKANADAMKIPFEPIDPNAEGYKEMIKREFEERWDVFNGLNGMTEEEVISIFGEDHPIIGVTHDVTMDRVKTVAEDYHNWMEARTEYNGITHGYNQMIYLKENQEMNKLRVIMESETDEKKKAQMQYSLEMYDDMKYLGFMAKPVSKRDFDMLVKAYADTKKIEYWLNRTKDKLRQLKMSSQVILEISQFEKRYLPEKYHTCNNFILLYFMKTIVYANISEPKDTERRLATAMIMALDGVIRNIYDEEGKEKVKNNLQLFLDQFVDTINNVYPEEERPGYKKEETPTES